MKTTRKMNKALLWEALTLTMLVGIGGLAVDVVNAAPTITVFTAGVNDNFALPPDPTSPSANLIG